MTETAALAPFSVTQVLIAIPLMALIVYATRAFPFVLFSRTDPPRILRFIERYIPPMVMAILVIYCLKDVSVTIVPQQGVPYYSGYLSALKYVLAIAFVAVVHIWKRNSLISIFGGTALFMILGIWL